MPLSRSAATERSVPIWSHTLTESMLSAVPLSVDLPSAVDVVIIGGGIIGLSCAFHLAERGLNDVVLIERESIASRASGANAGGLWPNQQGKKPGPWKTLADEGLLRLASLAERGDFDFHFRRNGILTLIRDPAECESTAERVRQMRDQGFCFEFVTQEQVREMEPLLTPDVFAGIYCPSDAHCNPLLLSHSYARNASRLGVRIVEQTEVEPPCPDGGISPLRTSRGTIACDRVICCNGAWAPPLIEPLGYTIPIVPARGQMIATKPMPPLLRTSIIGTYMFGQLVSGHIISGGSVEFAGFDDQPTKEMTDHIWQELQSALPPIRDSSILTSWSGLRPHTPDELPIVGPLPGNDHVIIAAGHFKNGVLFSALTGEIVADLVTNGCAKMDITPLRADRFGDRSGSLSC